VDYHTLLRALGQAEERGEVRARDVRLDAIPNWDHGYDRQPQMYTATIIVALGPEDDEGRIFPQYAPPPTVYPVEEFWKYARQVIPHAATISADELDEQLMDFLAARIAARRSST
jgi:hypothetical protein